MAFDLRRVDAGQRPSPSLPATTRCAVVAALAMLASATPARAQGSTPVPPSVQTPSVPTPALPSSSPGLAPAPPFDHWCVAPACTGAVAVAAPVQVPPAALALESSAGFLEQRARDLVASVVSRAAGEVSALTSSGAALADVALALAAVASRDAPSFASTGGLGAAVARAGLTYALDPIVPPDPACGGAARLDALYAGLAHSASLRTLHFPMAAAPGASSAACAATVTAAASKVDAAVLAGAIPPAAVTAAGAALQSLTSAGAACAVTSSAVPDPLQAVVPLLPRPGQGASIANMISAAAAAHRALPSLPAEAPWATCSESLKVLGTIDLSPVQSFAQQGLADADISGVLSVMASAPRSGELAAVLGRLKAEGRFSAESLRLLARGLAARAAQSVQGPVADAVGALEHAVVDGPVPTVRPDLVLASLEDRYAPPLPLPIPIPFVRPSPWVVELNGGLPDVSFKTNDLLMVADGTFGYSGDRFGVVGSGGIDYEDLVNSAGESEVDHARGAVEAWWLSGGRDAVVRVEVRLAAGLDYYDTTFCPSAQSCNESVVNPMGPLWLDYDSLLFRGSALAGIRVKTSRFSLQALGGGGGQYESQDTSTFGAVSTGLQYSLSSQTNASALGTGRVMARWRVVPGWLSLRARGDGTFFSITRDSLGVTVGPGGMTSTGATTEQDQQIELHGRAFVEADVLSFFEFVPALWAGFDYVSISGSTSATTATSTVPVFGVGVRRDTL